LSCPFVAFLVEAARKKLKGYYEQYRSIPLTGEKVAMFQ
jgi:hypothetical protein